jgi:hypothetical protein
MIVGTAVGRSGQFNMARSIAVILAFAAVSSVVSAQEPAVRPIAKKDMQPGYGVVESIAEVRVVSGERSAAAGGSAPGDNAGRPAYRVGVRLADGSLQYRDLDKPEFKVGDNVLLTNAGDVVPD